MHDHILTTARLTLRAVERDDVDDVYAYARDPEWARYLDPVIPSPYTLADAEEWVGRQIAGPKQELSFVIVHAGTVVGSATVRLDRANGTHELGWSLRRDHWGQGYMTEAVSCLVDFAFETLEAARVFARADLRNIGSWRVMEKTGMTREGVLRQHRVDRFGDRFDEVVYGVLRAEWQGNPSED